MLSIKVIYNDKNQIPDLLPLKCSPLFEFFNEDNPKEIKKAWKYKREAGARQVPFIGVHEDGKLIKAFYTEDNSVQNFLNWLVGYLNAHSKKGWIEISDEDGKVYSGQTGGFIEGMPLLFSNSEQLSDPTQWWQTAPITSIDWNQKIFKTTNSTYSFTFNEKSE